MTQDIELKQDDLPGKQEIVLNKPKQARFPWTAFCIFLLILICGFFALFGWKLYQQMQELAAQQPLLMRALNDQENFDKRLGATNDALNELSQQLSQSNDAKEKITNLENDLIALKQQIGQGQNQANQWMAYALLEQALYNGAPLDGALRLAEETAPDDVKAKLSAISSNTETGLKTERELIRSYNAPVSNNEPWWRRWVQRFVKIRSVQTQNDLSALRAMSEQDSSTGATKWRRQADAVLTVNDALKLWRDHLTANSTSAIPETMAPQTNGAE